MTDRLIYEFARRIGILVDWTDAVDKPQRVHAEALRRILTSLGYPSENDKDVERRFGELSTRDTARCPGLITCNVNESISLPNLKKRNARLLLENGSQRDVKLEPLGDGRVTLRPIADVGYHALQLDDRAITLAVAPTRCFTFSDLVPGEKLWGLAAQLYGLKRNGDCGIGDTTALAILAKSAAKQGADSIAISPTHAMFNARPDKFSPYSPSNRLFLNPLLADPAATFGRASVEVAGDFSSDHGQSGPLIDWTTAATCKMSIYRNLFESFSNRLANHHDELVGRFVNFRKNGGALLENHARFEAIHAALIERGLPHDDGWLTWPNEFSSPDTAAVANYAAAHESEVTFHVFLQWLADEAFGKAQLAAREAGMRIGLIADLAVGMERGGSYAWSRRNDVLAQMTIGAPPDLFNAHGQNWGLTTLSPFALIERDFGPFIATLRAAMQHAGGVRIDHILGLNRLWIVPQGAPSREGAYLSYPFEDLLRLVRLESIRHHAVVIGEDLGTVPEGFRAKLVENGIAGMDVLWFSRDQNGFVNPRQWRGEAVAMTSTHDLPTVAGWWCGADIQFRAENGLLSERQQEDAARVSDQTKLSQAFAETKIAPFDDKTGDAAVVDRAISFVATSPALLVLLPVEDLLGLKDQPNVPGTIDSHPNWRRRYPVAADKIFDTPRTNARAKVLSQRGKM